MVSSIFFVLILTCITGSAFSIAWIILRSCLEKKSSSLIIYRFIKIIPVLYMVPVVYSILYYYVSHVSSYDVMLASNNFINERMATFEFVWLVGAIGILTVNYYAIFKLVCVIRMGKEAPLYKKKLLNEVCNELGIKKKILLKESYCIVSPFIVGAIRPKIFVPAGHEFDNELKVIFYHELTHYKQKDLVVRFMYFLISVIYWFNPLVWYMYNEVKKWAEFSCDERCCERYELSEYFSPMVNIVEKSILISDYLVPMWAESNKGLIRRVKFMKRKKDNGVKKCYATTIIATLVFCGIGVLSSSIVTMAAQYAYNDVYVDTIDAIQEPYIPVEYEEYTVDAKEFEDGCIIEDGSNDTMMVNDNGTIRMSDDSFSWHVNNNVIKMSAAFSASSGQTISISGIVLTSNKYVYVGIYQPDGTYRYIYTKDGFTHTFSLTQTGSYKVFVKNQSGSAVDVRLLYVIS